MPPSKSIAHRIALSQLLSGAEVTVPDLNRDILATKRCAAALRPYVKNAGNVDGVHLPELHCGESGSTLRFVLPLALVLAGGGVFRGEGRLMERPLEPYLDIFRAQGVTVQRTGNILTVRGRLSPGMYFLPGDVSSQFVTGLLFALPLLPGESELVLTSPLESRDYAALTLDTLGRAGVAVENRAWRSFRIPGGQRYSIPDEAIEGDWSQAAFWYAANFFGNAVDIRGLHPASVQGDRAVTDLYQRMDAPEPAALEIDVSGIPDLLPPLAVMAAYRPSLTTFSHAGRLRLKESDRLETIAAMLRAFGVRAETGPDFLTVEGGLPMDGGPVTVEGANDHRVVMAAAVLASAYSAPVTILGAEAAEKSYPAFFDEYQRLGGVLRVL